MIRAEYQDKALVVDILVKSFNDNKSVNYLVKQDRRRAERMKTLMAYSFDICLMFGDIFLTENKKGCALVVMPDKKKMTFQFMLLDVKLALYVIGIWNLKKALAREAAIRKIHPSGAMYYLWFIGVDPSEQNKGIGSGLLQEVINEGSSKQRTICLETSTLKNIPWYQKFGFTIYNKLDFGYELFCLKRGE